MEIKKYEKNISKEELTSEYKVVGEHIYNNVTFEGAIVGNSPHPENKIAFIIKDSKTREQLICLEFTENEAVVVIKLLAEALRCIK